MAHFVSSNLTIWWENSSANFSCRHFKVLQLECLRRTHIFGWILKIEIYIVLKWLCRVLLVQTYQLKMNDRNLKRLAPLAQASKYEQPTKAKKKMDDGEFDLRKSLDMCCKHRDALKALQIYDSAVVEGRIKFNHHNYNVLLYLCSLAATGSPQEQERSFSTEKPRSK